jgi:hypothetical protein
MTVSARVIVKYGMTAIFTDAPVTAQITSFTSDNGYRDAALH